MSERSFILHEMPGYIANIFFAEYKDKVLLLDGGARGDAYRIERFVKETLKRPISDLKLSVVSHMHPDHAGGAPLIRRRFATPIAAHKNVDRWYRGMGGWLQHKIDTMLGQYSARKQHGWIKCAWYKRFIRPDYFLENGDVLPFFQDWTVHYMPGHTMYDIVLYHNNSQTLYVADIVLRLGEKFTLPFPVSFPSLMKNTLTLLEQFEVKTLILAHGGIINIKKGKFAFSDLADQAGIYSNSMFSKLAPWCQFPQDIRDFKNK